MRVDPATRRVVGGWATHGDQEGSAYNGYFERMRYHPLFLFSRHGDLERAMLQRGNYSTANFWRRVLLPVIDRYRDRDIPKYFRGDVAFALPALYRVPPPLLQRG